MKTKICTKCKIEKNLISFNANPATLDLHNCYCKKCASKYYKESYLKNRGKTTKSVNEYLNYNTSYKRKEIISQTYKRKNQNKLKGYKIVSAGKYGFQAYLHGNILGTYKTKKAAEQVIAKHKLREAKRKLEDKKLLHDDYYDTL